VLTSSEDEQRRRAARLNMKQKAADGDQQHGSHDDACRRSDNSSKPGNNYS